MAEDWPVNASKLAGDWKETDRKQTLAGNKSQCDVWDAVKTHQKKVSNAS